MILYSNGCPKCKILENELVSRGYEFTKSDDFTELMKVGYRTAPILIVNGVIMEFKQALDYIRS